MREIDALALAQTDKVVLWTEPNEKILLKFPNGTTTECWWREAVVSTYGWKLFRTYERELVHMLDERYIIRIPFQKSSLLDLWNKVMADTETIRGEIGITEDILSRMIALEFNKLHNDCCRYLTAYTTSSTARELREIIHHPEMEAVYERLLQASHEGKNMHAEIQRAYGHASELLNSHPDFWKNGYARAFRAKVIDQKQFLQVIVVRGFVVDIDNYQFPDPVLSGFGRGIHHIGDLTKISRDASIAQLQSHTPVQKSDYLNRRLQLLTMLIQHIVPGDCGTKETIPWEINNATDLKSAEGTYYYDESGKEHMVNKQDKHLIGKRLQIRTAAVCHKLHEYGVCEKCLGAVSHSIPESFRIGHISVIGALSAFVQLSLSAKHLITTKESSQFELDAITQKYLKFPRQDERNQLVMQHNIMNKLSNYTIELIFSSEEVKFITDMENNLNPDDIQLSTASSISEAGIRITNKLGEEIVDILTLSDMGRHTHLTKDFITYMLENLELVQMRRKRVCVSLAKWEKNKPVIFIPHKITGVLDFMNSFERTIMNGCNRYNISARTPAGIADMMRLCYNIVVACVDIPVSHLGVMIAALLVRDKSALDYRLPLPGGKREFTSLPGAYGSRSWSQSMAYERRTAYYHNPANMLVEVPPNHPMDSLYFPQAYNCYTDILKAAEKFPMVREQFARLFADLPD